MRWMVWMCALAMVGCGDDDGPAPDGGVDAAMVDGGDLDGGVEGDAGDEDAGTPSTLCPAGDAILDPVSGAPAFVVVGGDYTSSAVSLLAADGTVLVDSWIDSGTTAPGLVTTLSGDVVVPTRTLDGTVALIDRFMTDVVSLWCLDGSLVGQLRVRGADGSFSSNPTDVVVLDENEGWISRYEQNLAAGAPELDRGSDLVGFDPSTMTTDGRRVDLTAFGGTVRGLDGEGEEVDVAVWPRPSSIVPVGDLLVVGLDRIPADLFGTARGAGEGTVVVVDLADLSVSSLELEGLRNCGRVQAIPGAEDEVLVSCAGYSNVGFADAAGVRATAGLVRLRAVDGELEVVTRWDTREDDAALLATSGAVALGGDRVVGVAAGDFATVGDRLVLTNLATGDQSTLLTVDESFVLGSGAVLGNLLLWPDATSTDPVMRRFAVGETLTEGESFEVGPASLPPRGVSTL